MGGHVRFSQAPRLERRRVAPRWSAQRASILDSLPPGVTPQMVDRGQEVSSGIGGCANCHGPEAGGLKGPDLTDTEWWHAEGTYLAIVRQILVRVPLDQSTSGVVMPPRGGSQIRDPDVQAVAAYVWALSRRGRSRHEPDRRILGPDFARAPGPLGSR